MQNITGLEKPFEKLITVVAEGLGETANLILKFDAKKIKRIGEAEAEVEKVKMIKKAEASNEVSEILQRAQNRVALEQFNKQTNLENIIVKSKEKLEDVDVSEVPVDKDWAFRFMNIAQDVSREDLQDLLSKILAEEIKIPETFSLRTLDFVKNVSKEDLLLFKKISILSDIRSRVYLTKDDANEGFFNVTYAEIMQMIELGFIQSSLNTIIPLKNVSLGQTFPLALIYGNKYLFSFSEEQTNVNLPLIQFTTIGKEIAPLLEINEVDKENILKYTEELTSYWKSKKLIN